MLILASDISLTKRLLKSISKTLSSVIIKTLKYQDKNFSKAKMKVARYQ